MRATAINNANDHLLSCFIHTVTQSIEDAKAAAKEQIATQRMERNADLPKVGQILKLFTSDQIAATTPFQTVRSAAFAILTAKLDDLADYISTIGPCRRARPPLGTRRGAGEAAETPSPPDPSWQWM